MSSRVVYAIYKPPGFGLPFLAVMIGTDGEVTAVPYDTVEECLNHNEVNAEEFRQGLSDSDNA